MMQQTHTTLSNGLQSFADVSPDYALAPVGIGSFKEQADKLAEYGRNGDIYVVHAAEGETVVPMEVLEANPKVKELLFGQMREMGLDPGEFIVGNELNSINPATGMPEFFFKSIFRAVKKAVKKVVGFAKKAAPVVLPIAAAAFGIPFLGPAFAAGTFGAGFVGGGIGSLVAGKSLKESLKDGLMSGGVTSLMSGITGGLTGKGTFSEGFGRGLQRSVAYTPETVRMASGASGAPCAPGSGFDFTNFASDVATPTQQGESFSEIFTGKDKLGAAESFLQGTPYKPPAPVPASAPFVPNQQAQILSTPASAPASTSAPAPTQTAEWIDFDKGVGRTFRQHSPWAETATKSGGKKVYGTFAEDAIRAAAENKFLAGFPTPDVNTMGGSNLLLKSKEVGEAAVKAAQPTMLQKWTVPAGAALVAGAAFKDDLFGVENPEEITEDMLTGYGQDTGVDLYRKAMEEGDPKTYQVEKFWADVPGMPKYNPYATSIPPIATAATGGLASFPRRDGAINGPGTERSDDIPAMLSDGEFVITGKAVRGAAKKPTGDPETDRRNGSKNMYAMMRNFEMRA